MSAPYENEGQEYEDFREFYKREQFDYISTDDSSMAYQKTYSYLRKKGIKLDDKLFLRFIATVRGHKEMEELTDNHNFKKYRFNVACLRGILDKVRAFITSGLSINKSSDKFKVLTTPLHQAVWFQNVETVKLLLSNNADPNESDDYGMTPLHKVCAELYDFHHRRSCVEHESLMLRLLLNHRANVHKKDCFEMAPIFYIFSNNLFNVMISEETEESVHANAVDTGFLYQLDVYAKVFFRDTIGANAINLFLKAGVDVNAKDMVGNSLLQLAISNINFSVVQLLLENGADVKTIKFIGGYFEPDISILPSLELFHNLMDILSLLLIRGYELTFPDKLNILNFLVNSKDFVRYRNVSGLFAFGSAQKIRETVDKLLDSNRPHTISEGDVPDEKMVSRIDFYLKVVKEGEMYMEDYTYIFNRMQSFIKYDLLNYHIEIDSKYRAEIELAKHTTLNNQKFLLDICRADPEDRYDLFVETDYFTLLTSPDFEKNFKTTQHIIKGYFLKAFVRKYCVMWGADFLERFSISPRSRSDCVLSRRGALEGVQVIRAHGSSPSKEESVSRVRRHEKYERATEKEQ
uniref:Uncharacterized protein n=1 Tax=Trichogramma kaykai TaxID=54128 RepID=A0ABD2XEP8_9HYME